MADEAKGKLFEEYADTLAEKAVFAAGCTGSVKNNQRAWFSPKAKCGELDNPIADTVTDPTSITKLFSRETILEAYKSYLEGDGCNHGDLMATQYQGFYMMDAERTFRARHITPSRKMAHGLVSKLGWMSGRNESLLTHIPTSFIDAAQASIEEKLN